MSIAVRRPRPGLVAVDLVVVGVLAGIGINELRSVGEDIFYRSADGLGIGLVILQTVPLLGRRFAPVPAAAAITLAAATMLWLEYPETNALLAIPLALYSVGAARSRRTTTVVLVAVLAILVPPLALRQAGTFSFLLVAVVVFAVGAFAGDGARSRRLYAEALELQAEHARHERQLEAREAVIAERNRIARELHDAIGHTVNVMVMQAGAGRLAGVSDASKSIQALEAIEDVGRATLGDIDRLLGLLREDDDRGATRRPTVGTRDLPALVQRLAGAGLDVTFEVVGEGGAVPGPVDTATYRIVQEALTNALKHAPGAKVDARVSFDHETVRIDVANEAASERPGDAATPGRPNDPGARPRGGRGLLGMHERVAALGGQLDVGPTPGGGYSVHALLPLRATTVNRRSPDLARVEEAG